MVFGVILILVFYVPYDLAFGDLSMEKFNFNFDMVVTFIFTFDIMLCFILSFENEDGK